jgi:hypothetical protein
MNTLGYDQALQLRTALMPIAYLLCTTGLIMSVFRHWGNFHEILMSIVGIGVIVILLNGYPTALTTLADGFKTLREQTTAGAPGGMQPTWTQIFQAQIEQPSWNQWPEKLEIAVCQMLKSIGQIAIWFLNWVQAWAFNGLIAISPVLIGALAVPWTQGAGITFLTTSFGVAAWHLGIALVDILLADIAGTITVGAGISGGVTAATTISLGILPVFIGILAGIICIALAMYLAVPLIMAAVLRGASPLTTGAKAGMEMALSALGVAGLAGARLGAAFTKAPVTSAEKPASGDGKGEDPGMAQQPSTTSPTGTPTAAQSKSAPAKASDETPAQRQARILDEYENGKPGRRITPTTRLIDQAG